jgi:hypothetical protein
MPIQTDQLPTTKTLGRREFWTVISVYVASIFILSEIYFPLLPNFAGGVGGDYSMFIPDLLAGYYWILHNGYFTIPWFSPAECGGIPFFADPQVGYFSVPQALTLLVSPLRAIQAMFFIFASAGFFGAYYLSRTSFRSSVPAALLAAALFMFNGFYATRVLVGHMTFHAFMLLPVAAAMLLEPTGARRSGFARSILRLLTAAGCFAYMVQAGSFVILLPALLSLLLVILIHMCRFGWRSFPLFGLMSSGIFGVLLSAGKLAASLAFVAQFPRATYPLPGISGLWSDIYMAVMSVFFWVPADAPHRVVNSMWLLERHEWEYGVSPIPLVLMVAALAGFAVRARMQRRWPHVTVPRALLLAALCVLLLLPIALNWYQPDWNTFLKNLPLIGSSSNLLRWFSAYMLPAVIGGALALDAVCSGTPWLAKRRGALAAACIVVVAVLNLTKDLSAYGPQGSGGYQVSDIEAAYRQASDTGAVPPITHVIVQQDRAGNIQMTPQRDDALIRGHSQLLCYQPIFGYRLERFPIKSLRPGPALGQIDHTLNIKDPSCYVFPDENQCHPGDQFDVLVRDRAEAFLDYRPYPFSIPLYARAANWASELSFLLLIAGALISAGLLLAKRIKGEARPQA